MKQLEPFYMQIRWTFHLLLLVSWTLASCNSMFVDQLRRTEGQPLNTPEAKFWMVAWLDNDLFAFTTRPTESDDGLGNYRVSLFYRNTGRWQELEPPPGSLPCYPLPSHFVHPTRLPDGNLGFAYECYVVPTNRPGSPAGVAGWLYVWDRQMGTFQIVKQYAPPFAVSEFAFAPDMNEVVQERASGLNNKLYHVVLSDSQIDQLVPHFQRARSPSWSPDGQTIAFAGTETYPGGDSSAFRRWGQIEGLLLYPWDIYLMDADGDNLRILLPKAGRPYQLKWAPQGKFLAFAGDSPRDVKGIWVLNTETLVLTRVWHENTSYDWSPDGRQMVIIENTEQNGVAHTHPIIIDVPISDP